MRWLVKSFITFTSCPRRYILQLAIADLILMVTIPFHEAPEIWRHSQHFCKACWSIFHISYYSSILFLMVRYVMISVQSRFLWIIEKFIIQVKSRRNLIVASSSEKSQNVIFISFCNESKTDAIFVRIASVSTISLKIADISTAYFNPLVIPFQPGSHR